MAGCLVGLGVVEHDSKDMMYLTRMHVDIVGFGGLKLTIQITISTWHSKNYGWHMHVKEWIVEHAYMQQTQDTHLLDADCCWQGCLQPHAM